MKNRLLVLLMFFCCVCGALDAGVQTEERVRLLTEGLPLGGAGIEIAPFFRPTLLKQDCNIYYTDYATAAELKKKHEHLEIAREIAELTVESDFIWRPGETLVKCIPAGMRFDYAIASHVIEHVPNVIGWLVQILDVLKPGGVLSLAIPDKRATFDVYRSETHVSEMVDAWLRNQKIPSSAQIYDMLSNAVDAPSGSFPQEEGIPFASLHRNYTDQQALEFAIHAFTTGSYLDIHCSVFTPDGFRSLLLRINELGLLNIAVSDSISRDGEFFLRLTKLGEPRIRRDQLIFVPGQDPHYPRRGSGSRCAIY